MQTRPVATRQIVAAVIGNALEWYDFVIYGFLTVIISRLFFPADNEYASLLMTMVTFGVGFFMRPVGGVLIGMYADKHGRKAALQLIILLMTISIAMIAFAPTYAAIGVAAPVIILLARLLQGMATGGEFASATSFLVECAPPGRRGFFGSLQMVGQSLAALAGVMAAPIYQVSPMMGADIIIVVFAVVVIGGMGSIMGSILSGFGLGLIEGLTKVVYPEASNTVIFVIMAIVLLIKPAGLFGTEK